MKKIISLLFLMVFSLSSCRGMGIVTSGPNPFSITPSRPPSILTPTPIFVFPTSSPTPPPPPSYTPTGTSIDGAASTSTETPTSVASYTPSPALTATPGPIQITMLGCETGLDLTHGVGEVTNAYIVISNSTGLDLTNACTTLSSADEGRAHPNKTGCTPDLPAGYQVTLKLTIDTTISAATIFQVAVSSEQGLGATLGELTCTAIGTAKPADDTMGVIKPIP